MGNSSRTYNEIEGGDNLQRNQYMHGLDGLRTLAVFAVIIYHLNYAWAPGGLLGVGIFFVLSGYLISDILLDQWNRLHRLDFKGFWIRRAKRLLPALFTMLITVIVWSFFLNRNELPVLRQDSLAAVFYVSNWWYIFHQVSYFQSFGQPSPFEHLWSLAVEEQFYLLFPLFLWMGLRWISNSKWLLALSSVLAAFSACLMAWLYQPGVDPSRVYFGTDTRAFAFLIGFSLAIICPSRNLKNSCSKTKIFLLDGLGIVCLLVLIACIFRISEYNSFLFQGGLFIISLITAILIGVIAQPTSILGKLFAWKPLKWLGERSYGIYLWHYPVIVLSSPVSNVDGTQWMRMVLQVTVTIGLAAVSYRWIENPIRYGTISRPLIVKSSIAILAGVLCLVLPIPNDATDSISTATTTTSTIDQSTKPAPSTLDPTSNPKSIPKQPITNPTLSSNQTTPKEDPSPGLTPKPVQKPIPLGTKVTAIGDSIMVDIEPDLKKLIPGIVVDGKVGRQLIQTPPEISYLKSAGKLGNVVVIELGTNGPFTWGQLQNLYQSLGNRKQVIFVNTRVPRPWQSDVNNMLAKFVSSTPHTTLVDWYTKSTNQYGYFGPDGVHLTQKGSRVLASIIKDAIQY